MGETVEVDLKKAKEAIEKVRFDDGKMALLELCDGYEQLARRNEALEELNLKSGKNMKLYAVREFDGLPEIREYDILGIKGNKFILDRELEGEAMSKQGSPMSGKEVTTSAVCDNPERGWMFQSRKLAIERLENYIAKKSEGIEDRLSEVASLSARVDKLKLDDPRHKARKAKELKIAEARGEEGSDQAFTRFPTHCTQWECEQSGEDIELKPNDHGFMSCPRCKGSYGKPQYPLGIGSTRTEDGITVYQDGKKVEYFSFLADDYAHANAKKLIARLLREAPDVTGDTRTKEDEGTLSEVV